MPKLLTSYSPLALKIVTLFVISFSLLFLPQHAQGAVGVYEKINFQGKLQNANGTNVTDGNYSVTFTLYDHATVGSNLWDEVQTVVVADGVFQVELGTVDTTIAAVDFNTDTLYLGVKVEADAEMTPRIRFTAVPYAFMAEKVNGLTVTNTTGTFTLANAKTLTVNNSLTFSGTDSTVFTFPTATGTVVTQDSTETLTNKTLTAPKFADGGFLADASGNEILILDSNATAVNELTISNGATGVGPTIIASGETNVPLTINSKAAGALTLDSGTTGTINLGTSNNAKIINVGTGTAGNTINIGTNNTTLDTISIGSALDDVAITGDQWSITNAGVLTVVSCSGCGSGAQTPWAADIDAEGFDLTDLSNLELRETTGAPAGTVVGLYRDNTGDLNLNALTGKTINLQVNGTDEYNFSSTAITVGANNIDLSTGNIAFSGAGNITLTGGTISDVTDGVDINDDLDVSGVLAIAGGDGSSFAGGITFNDDVLLTLAGTEAFTVNNTTQGASDLLSFNSTWTGANAADVLSIATTYNLSTNTGLQYGLNLTNADNTSNTGVIDALALFSNDQATETLADGIILRHNVGSGVLTDGLQIENTTAGGTITNAINILETAGTITTGINIGTVGTAISVGEVTTVLDSANLDISNAGAITGATGITSSGTITFSSMITDANAVLYTTTTGVVTRVAETETASLCLISGAGASGVPTWATCPGGASGATDGSGITYVTDTTDDFAIGGSTTAAPFYFDIDGGASNSILYLGVNESKNGGLTFYSSGAGETDPTITADASGNLILSAGSGTVQVGSGTGNITMSLTAAADVFIADKTLALAAAYSANDYTFKRVLTSDAGGETQAGSVVYITDTGDGTGTTVNPDMLLVNPALSAGTFTGNLLRLQVAGTNKLVVDSAGDITMGATTPSVTVASAETFTIGDGTDTFAINYSGNSFALTSGSNGFTFDADTGPSYSGNARPTRQVSLTPEFAGAVLTGSGTGSMTSDFCEQGVSTDITDTNTTICESGQVHNYYSWTSTSGSNTYSLYVRWRVPDNFSSWGTSGNPIQAYGRVSDSADGAVTVTVFDTAGTVENSGGTAVDGASNTWTQTTVEAAPLEGTYTAGSYVTFKIDLQVTGTDTAQIGEINLNYLSTN